MILTLLGYIATRTVRIVVTGVVSVAAIVVLHRVAADKKAHTSIAAKGLEAFTNPAVYETNKSMFQGPSAANPAMNLLPSDPVGRKPAAPAFNPSVGKDMNQGVVAAVTTGHCDPKLSAKLFSDLGDNFNFNQSMRTWYAMPNTQTPNDQEGFAKFCYGKLPSCKDQEAEGNKCG